MTQQERALRSIAEAFEELAVPFMIIGGMANAVWGEPRATLDVDVTVWVLRERMSAVLTRLSELFRCLVDDAREFVMKTRVLPLETSEGVRIDVVFGQLPFEEEAIRRAARIEVAGLMIPFCTAEDLILMKIISTRARDLEDARGVTIRRILELDLKYLDPRVAELGGLLGRAEIVDQWKRWKREAHRALREPKPRSRKVGKVRRQPKRK